MQRRITNIRRSDDEVVKEGGLLLDFDEIARHGKMTLEESKVAKAYGVYTTRHPNYFMVRIVVPGGVLTTSQVRGLSKIIKAYAQGRICVDHAPGAAVALPSPGRHRADDARAGQVQPGHVPRLRRQHPQHGRVPLGLGLPAPAVRRAALRPQDGRADRRLPRPGQPAAQVQDHLLRLPGQLRPAAHQLRRGRGHRAPAAPAAPRRPVSACSSAAAWAGGPTSASCSTASCRATRSSRSAAPWRCSFATTATASTAAWRG